MNKMKKFSVSGHDIPMEKILCVFKHEGYMIIGYLDFNETDLFFIKQWNSSIKHSHKSFIEYHELLNENGGYYNC